VLSGFTALPVEPSGFLGTIEPRLVDRELENERLVTIAMPAVELGDRSVVGSRDWSTAYSRASHARPKTNHKG
jgi:hypothetical protein